MVPDSAIQPMAGAQPEFPETRWSLVARLRDRPGQVSLLVELYADAIRRYLSHRLPRERLRERIDDVLQEVAIDLLAKPDVLARAQPGAGSRFRYLVMTMALNAARNFLRKDERRREHEHATEALPDLASSAEADLEPPLRDAMDRAWAESILAQALADLDGWVADGSLEADAATLLREHLIRGRSLRELAVERRLPLTSCHRRLAKARQFLQSTIVDRLTASGELPPGSDGTTAWETLLAALKRA